MALSLSAEQKNLKSLFINDDQYIVPSFQRPYRWTKKETKQLFDDITQAFYLKEDYFVGNIVIARGKDDTSTPQIIDGQQRILTLWMFLKVLAVITKVSRLEEMLSKKSWEDNQVLSKIHSLVFEEADQSRIQELLNWEIEDFKLKTKEISKLSQIQSNAVYIYKWMKDFFCRIEGSTQTEFWKYFVDKVYLLPIVLDGNDMIEATSRALKIFETINNRGLDLADADILKAKLYEMSRFYKEEGDFIAKWKDLGQKCVELNVPVNDIFRYYLRILRAKNDQTTSEPNLRNFFLNNEISPFKTSKWRMIMDELNLIEKVLEMIENLRRSSMKIAMLYQILQEYSSVIPFSSIVIFVYDMCESGKEVKEKEVIDFLEKLIGICYTYEMSQDIKHKIFEINSDIMNKRSISMHEITKIDNFFDERTKYRNGFVLLYHYLIEENLSEVKIDSLFKVERIVLETDTNGHYDWIPENLSNDIDNMANFSVIDFPKIYKSLFDRSNFYNSSKLKSVSCILNGKSYYSYNDFNIRKNHMNIILSKFLNLPECEKDKDM